MDALATSGNPVPVFLLRSAIWVLLALSTACTSIRIENAEVTETHYLGFTVLEVKPRERGATLVDTQGFGMTFGPHSANIGYLAETLVYSPGDTGSCSVLILLKNASEAEALKVYLAPAGCSVKYVLTR